MRTLLLAAALAVGIHAPASASEVPAGLLPAVELPADLADAVCSLQSANGEASVEVMEAVIEDLEILAGVAS